jgi:phosphate acetyltransferase
MAAEFIENHTFADIEIGQSAQIERTLTRDDIALFSKASGDFNPTHVDDEFARSKGAEGVTAHSLWSTSLVSSLLGNVLPGPGTIYQKQDMAFQRPVVIGDTVTARIKAREKRDNNVVLFDCEVVNQKNEPVMTGLAEVVAPAEKIRIAKTDLPDVTVRHHDSYRELFEVLEGLEPIPAALIHPCDYVSLKGAVDAAESGFIQPVLVGPEHRIRAVAEEHEIDIDPYRIEDVEHSHAAAVRAVELVHTGDVEMLMKGSLHTDEVLGAVVSRSAGIRTERRISHVFAMDVPTYPKLLLITDAAVNVAPGLAEKADICQNAIDLSHTLGIDQPKLAILSAMETVNPKVQSTLDAAALCKMADRGQITGGVLDGPLAMDNAINVQAAETKGIISSVAGRADVLVAPDLEAGNILAKQLTFMGNAEAAGIVLGARVPIILTSRSDGVRARRASAALAVLHAHALRKKAMAGLQ